MAKKSKAAKIPYWENVMWYTMALGAVFIIVSVVPVLPWRYNRVDTNMGNRFVMERYYNVMGPTNQMGKYVNWLTMRRKMQRKVEEFGRPSPLASLAGTATASMGVGGAAAGCMNWQACKEHVQQRSVMYETLAYASIATLISVILGFLSAIAAVIYLGFEQATYGKDKKKKKKKSEDSPCTFEPATKTMNFAIAAFTLPFFGISGYVVLLGNTLKQMQQSAYYPFAGSHLGPFVGGFGVFLLWIGMMIAINRVSSYTDKMKRCCGRGSAEDDEALLGEQAASGYPGGVYGAYPGAAGAYGAYPGADAGYAANYGGEASGAYGAAPEAHGAGAGGYEAYGGQPGGYPQQQW